MKFKKWIIFLTILFFSSTGFSQSLRTIHADIIEANLAGAGVDISANVTINSSTTSIDNILDEDDMASDSDTALASQQSIKAYVDGQTVASIDDISDVTITSATTGQVLTYDGAEWINGASSGGGVSAWVTSTAYLIGNVVHENNHIYIALTNHTSGVFVTDLANNEWIELTDGLLSGIGDVTITSATTNDILTFNGTVWENTAALDELNYNTSSTSTCVEGKTFWNSTDKTLNVCTDQTDVSLQVGQEMHKRIYNDSGSTITNGQVVYINGFNVSESLSTVALAKADSATTSRVTLGIATHDILDSSIGIITNIGTVRELDTSGFSTGDELWLSSATSGAITNTMPSSPNFAIKLGTVGGISSATGTIDVAIDIGTNTGDVIKIFNGAILEDHDFTVTSNGTVVTASLERSGGGDLSLFFNGIFDILDTSPAATVALTPGSDTSPTQNYVFIPETTMLLTANTTGFPAAQHIPVGTVMVQSASTSQVDAMIKVHAWSDHLSDSNDQGHLSHINKWIRNQHATWKSGVVSTINGTGTNNISVDTTSGVALQLHEHAFPSFTTASMYVINDSVTPYIKRTNLALATLDSTGATLLNRTFAMVLWGVVNETSSESKLFINLPSCSYSAGKPAEARADASSCTNTVIPAEYKGTGFLISRIVMSVNPAGTIWTVYSGNDDLRGVIPASSGGTGSTTATSFSDNLFNVFNVTDDTKIVDFDVSGVTTATTRTMTIPDIDGTIVVEDASSDVSITNLVASGEIESAKGIKSVGVINSLVLNNHFETNTTGWTTFDDGTTYVDGTGGSPTALVATRNVTTPMYGTGDLQLTAAAGACQGEGISVDFTIPKHLQGKKISVKIPYDGSGANIDDGDFKAYIYDVTNSRIIEFPDRDILAGNSKYDTAFQASSDSLSYRLSIMCDQTAADAITWYADNISVQQRAATPTGIPATDWEDYTPTTQSIGTPTITEAKYRRFGDSVEIIGKITAGTVTAAEFQLGLPTGLVVSSDYSAILKVGVLDPNIAFEASYSMLATAGDTFLNYGFRFSSGTVLFTPQLGTSIGTGTEFSFSATVKIEGWSSNSKMSSDTLNREIYTEYRNNAAEVITANVTDIPFSTKTKDNTSSWDGNSFEAPETAEYLITGSVHHNSIDTFFETYIDGTVDTRISQRVATTIHTFSTQLSLSKGQVLSIRSGVGITLNTGGQYHHISISKVGGSSQTIFESETVAARYTSANGQTISAGSFGIIDFESSTSGFDTHNAVTTGASWKFEAPVSGLYHVSSSLIVTSTNIAEVETIQFYLYKNGAAYAELYFFRSQITTAVTTSFGMAGSTIVELAKGDYIDLRANEGITGTSALAGNSEYNHISIHRVK